VTSNGEERNRVFGVPLGTNPHAGQGEEQHHILGIPDDWFGPVDYDWLRALIHPIRGYKRWIQHRQMGPYAPD
jgi:hypothetical protein